MTRSSVRFYGWSKVRPRAGLDVVMRYNEIGNGAWCNKEAKKKKKKEKGRKNEIYFSHLSRAERAAYAVFYLKRLFFYSRTYTESTTRG